MSAGVSKNRRTLTRLMLFSGLMFGAGYALVPFYDVFCEATGLNRVNLTAAPENTQVDTGRLVTIELDANAHGVPWQFRPLQRHVAVHPGELTQIEFEIVNTTGEPITGQAIPSYAPRQAAEFFQKLNCFCFQKQTLAAGERRVMPVSFTVDRKLPKEIGTITLSYTFFEVEGARRAERPKEPS